jgi:F-type H+-transporting ATPase subunit gamma
MAEHMESIKRQIRSINSTKRITNAMKLVSAAKLRKAKARFLESRRFMDKVTDAMEEIMNEAYRMPHAFIEGNRRIKKTCYIVITGSNGFCGSYNGDVIRRAEALMNASDHESVIVTIGSKGKDRFQHIGRTIIASHDDPPDHIKFTEAQELASKVIDRYLKGEFDEVVLVYTHYVNTLRQEVTTERLLPVKLNSKAKQESKPIDYRPSTNAVLEYLIPTYFDIRLYNASIEAATCEHACRRSAMESASDNANDMLQSLQVRYNRARQSRITDEIIEVVSGAGSQTE